MPKLIRRNLLRKNLLLHVLLIPFYWFADNEVSQIPVQHLDTLLLFVGLIVIAPITSNFIYSYAHTNTKEGIRWGHVTTFLSMLVIGILFSVLDILLLTMIGNIITFRIAILLFWFAVITFDFADSHLKEDKWVFRSKRNQKI